MKEKYNEKIAPSLELMLAIADIKGTTEVLEIAINEATKLYYGIPKRESDHYNSYLATVKTYYDFLTKEVYKD